MEIPENPAPVVKYPHLKTKEKRREYNHKFYEKNRGKDIKRACDVCNGSFTIFNKSHHKQSKKHKKALLRLEEEARAKEAEEIKNIENPEGGLSTEKNI